jgi:hypothetical protein
MLKVPVYLHETQKLTQEQGGIVYSIYACTCMPSEVWTVTVGVRNYQFCSFTRTEHVT